MSNEVVADVVEPKCYVPCLCCNWLILEGELHLCICGCDHTPELSWPEGGIPDAEDEIHEFRLL